jgi:hypothetical protein
MPPLLNVTAAGCHSFWMSRQLDASATLHTSPDDLFLANQPAAYSHFHTLRAPLKANCILAIVVTLGYFQRHSQRRHIL